MFLYNFFFVVTNVPTRVEPHAEGFACAHVANNVKILFAEANCICVGGCWLVLLRPEKVHDFHTLFGRP